MKKMNIAKYLILLLIFLSFTCYAYQIDNNREVVNQINLNYHQDNYAYPNNITYRQLSYLNNQSVYTQFNKIQNYVIKRLNQKMEQYPKNMWYFVEQGWMNISIGRFQKAVTLFDKSIEIMPTSSAYFGLGMAYNNLGKTKLANEAYHYGLSFKPENITNKFIQGPIFSRGINSKLDNTNLGIDTYNIISYRNSKEINSELKSCFTLLLTRQKYKAIEAFRNYLETDPNSVIGLIGLGYSYFNSGNEHSAIQTFQKALNLNSRSAAALTGIGRVEFREGDFDKAIYYFNRALEINPKSESAYYGKLQTVRFMHLKNRELNSI
ncbi:MAG TPA: tetratricopeptide repeat protein [Victivallales bacterium]|nr:tetratricopeptide repeat protein [Victivallales bacterium]